MLKSVISDGIQMSLVIRSETFCFPRYRCCFPCHCPRWWKHPKRVT